MRGLEKNRMGRGHVPPYTDGHETQFHILECIPLIGQSEIVTYIPNFKEYFNDDDLEAEVYLSRLIKDHHRRIKYK